MLVKNEKFILKLEKCLIEQSEKKLFLSLSPSLAMGKRMAHFHLYKSFQLRAMQCIENLNYFYLTDHTKPQNYSIISVWPPSVIVFR
jgi:hypothetical protein